ncbi:MAG: hypothetical protein LQ338_005020 [Usnochroma carphineum]|nr:MAG: hypothetical protein LQ338_005020 [Usnochroma carphineum]
MDAATAADPVIIGLGLDNVAAALLVAGNPVEDDTAAFFAALTEAMVWNVDICPLNGPATCDTLAAIGNAAIGHRQEQSQGSKATLEAAATAGTAVEADMPAVALESGVPDVTDGVEST